MQFLFLYIFFEYLFIVERQFFQFFNIIMLTLLYVYIHKHTVIHIFSYFTDKSCESSHSSSGLCGRYAGSTALFINCPRTSSNMYTTGCASSLFGPSRHRTRLHVHRCGVRKALRQRNSRVKEPS